MQKKQQLEDFEQMNFYEEAENQQQPSDILCDNPLSYDDCFFSKNSNQQAQNFLAIDYLKNQQSDFEQQHKQVLQNHQNKALNSYSNQFQLSLQQKHNEQNPVSSNLQEQALSKQVSKSISKQERDGRSKQIKKYDKNQYDKNIPGNIVLTVVTYLLKPSYKPEIQFYCRQMKAQSQDFDVDYSKTIGFAKQIKGRNRKFGISQLGHFFRNKKENNPMQKVFGLFMIRFLREQYILHILRMGKMSNKYRYLEYATKMMYIPRFREEEYSLIHQFRRKGV